MSDTFFTIQSIPAEGTIDLLKKNTIGTPGYSMVYQHAEVENKMKAIEDPYYVALKRNNEIIGTCCFCSRDTINRGEKIPAFYLRYVTFKALYRSNPQMQPRRKNKESRLRTEMVRLLSGEGLGAGAQHTFFQYAYVDPLNHRSAALCKEFAFEQVRTCSTLIFNRLNPKQNSRVEKLSLAELPQIKEKLESFYKDYTMFSFENIFRVGAYYVIRNHEGNIIVGVQVNPDRWKILEMPGITGKMLLNTFSFLPVLNRLIKKDYRFITLEGIYFSPGNEKALETLFESVLAIYSRNSAMLWLDTGSDLYNRIKSLRLGMVHSLSKEVTAGVICRFTGFKEEQREMFKNSPAYISGIDIT